MSQFNRFLWTGLVLGLAACGDDVTVTNPPEPPPPPTPGVTAVSVAPDGATINVGGTLGMTAAATLEPGAAAPTWAWSSSSAAATVAANGASATVTAVSAGSVGIRATATSGTSSASGVATVNIVAAAVCSISGVAVTPASADLVVNQTLQFAATVTGTNCVAADLGVTWSVVGSPAGATINASGVFSATAAGNYVIRATSTKDATKTNTAAVTVTVPAPATVSIQSITQFATNVPVDLTNVGGQIEITLNVDPGAAPQVTKAQALIDGIVVAEQIIAAPSAIAASPEAAPQTLVLSTNTRQVKKVGNVYVPVIHNGPRQITARIFVTASTVPAVSNAVPVVMQNADAWVPGTTPALTPVSLTPTFTTAGPTVWYTGNVDFAGGPNYIAFFPVTPTLNATSAACGASSNAAVGTPTGGLTLAGTFTCGSTVEGGVSITGWTVTPGTAPAPDFFYIAAVGVETVGSPFTVDGSTRYNLLGTGTLNNGNTVNIDNKAPTVTLKTIAFNTSFDQLWINGSYAFNAANVINTTSEAGTGVASTQVYAHPVAAIACGTATAVTTGADLAETITSTSVDGWRICARQVDNIGNVGSLAGFSNYFGVDQGAPTARFVTSTPPVPVAGISTVSATANTTIYSLAAPAAIPALIYGVEANDTRSGFHQGGALTNFPVNMSHTYFGVGVSTSCAVASYGLPTVLSDAWVRSIEQAERCVATPQYNTWSAYVTDRAGNVSATIARNYAKDDLAAADITNISFGQLLYAPGASAGFNVFGTDDLEIIEGTLALHYDGNNDNVPEFIVRYPYSLFPIGTRWDAAPLTNVVSGTPLSIASLIGRFDTTATATNLPSGGYASRQNALPDSVYANLRDVASQPDATPMGLSLNAITQFSDSTTAPWGTAPAAVFGDANSIWQGSTVGTNKLATQRTGTSVTVPYFDSVNLYGVIGGELVLCGTFAAPVLTDNGVFRTWQYTTPTPVAGNACFGAGAWRVGGVKGNAVMLSQQF